MLHWVEFPARSSHRQAIYFSRKVKIPTGPWTHVKGKMLLCPGGRSPACVRAWAGSGNPPTRGRWSTRLTGLESHPESHVARGVRRLRSQYRENRLGESNDLGSVSLAGS